MLIEDKVIEIFCMRDDFCKFFDAMTEKDTLKPIGKRKYHRSATILKTEVMLIMNLFTTWVIAALSISILKKDVSIFGISSPMLFLIIV